MKKPHLFFIKISTSYNIYYYTFKYDLEEVQSTTNSNIITIMKDILKDKIQHGSIMDFTINEIRFGSYDSYSVADIRRYLRNFIYYDTIISQWVVSYKNEPDYKLLNYIIDDISLRIIFIGSCFDNIIKNTSLRDEIFTIFSRYYHIQSKCDAMLYKISDETNLTEVEVTCNYLPTDINKKFAIVLEDGYKMSTIKKIYDFCHEKTNVDIFILIQSEYYMVTASDSSILLKKVCLR